ncbi:hypothetical protein O6H91_17G004900 [Diphasiastrum complanatum]|uniref:Uncharacterized protein n=1 Tax=Diphasiastrum complanatum TaxID=34168 RepID=A0ACC2B3T0_DIPCM|nr:hypothetical protein O6H91_17G004900 [Diphasiastrum complanatum]
MEGSDPYLHREMKGKKMLKKRWIIAGLVVIILLAVVIGLAVGLKRRKGSDLGAVSKTIQSLCNSTSYPDTCIASLSAFPGSSIASPTRLVGIAMNIAHQGANSSLHLVERLLDSEHNETIKAALKDCLENLADSIDQINVSLSHFSSLSLKNLLDTFKEIRTSLSSALTFQTTCIEDVFAGINGRAGDEISKDGHYVKQLVSNALGLSTILSSLQDELSKWKNRIPFRRLLSGHNDVDVVYFDDHEAFPEWLSLGSRKLLQANTTTVPNVTVAQDGTGQFLRIQDAVNAAANTGSSFYIISIKAGIYTESISIPKTAKNVMFVGDGVGKTIITGNKSVVGSGVSTFDTATLAVKGNGFFARDLTIENTAGPEMHQAVAVRVSADLAVFYKCSLAGYQDTLYTHTLRQFYKECTISGTVDFIFGNSAAVFQQCTLVALVPLPGQQNTITAQGRVDKFQNTGLSFHGCNVVGAKDLQSAIKDYPTFLGRPWKEYSRTVFLFSNISDILDPAGWLQWNGTPFALQTLFYGEYMNTGDGAASEKRVNWSTSMNEKQAEQFTVNSFLDGTKWLPATRVSFTSDLTS